MLAVHWIWSTYATWLPGDSRGHWSPLFDLYGQIIERGGRLNMPDPTTTQKAIELAKEPPKYLDAGEQKIIADSIAQLVRGPDIHYPAAYAAAIEATHVHLLTGVPNEKFGTYIGRIKGSSSSAVLQKHPGRSRTWASGYWKVYLFDDLAVQAVMRYIEAHNERKGLPAKPFSWIMDYHSPAVHGGESKTRAVSLTAY